MPPRSGPAAPARGAGAPRHPRGGEEAAHRGKRAVALLQLTLVADAIFGGSALRSAGIDDTPEERLRFRRFLQGVLERLLLGA